jgi:type II secretory pathway pseudopilin PulG
MDPAPKLDPMIEMALRSLHDIAMPQPVSWMPKTWGWAGLAIIILVLLLAAATKAIRRFRRNAYRREALQRLANLEKGITDAARRGHALRELAELLKRTALAAWPRARVAPLTRTGWTQFLDGSGGCGKGLARLLDDLEYRGNASLSSLPQDYAEDAFRAARQWIEKHHVSA